MRQRTACLAAATPWHRRVRFTLGVLVAVLLVAGGRTGEAHKPVTSPYTFSEDVFPILRDQCGRCHVEGGAAPMSLLTYQDTVPWGESIRIELLSGHMPPWTVETSPSRFRNVNTVTAKELNVLLTWATGGTPRGADQPATPASPSERGGWSLGPPDLLLDLPAPVTLGADVQDETKEITLQTGTNGPRWIRAVDLMPGTPSIVRSATISVLSSTESGGRDGPVLERLLALWLPGEDAVPLDAGAGFVLPAGAALRVRIHYRKTWQHERDTVTDRSRIGIYFAPEPAANVRALTLSPSASEIAAARTAGRLAFSRTLDEDLLGLAVYPDAALRDTGVTVRALRPDGSREDLIAFRPLKDWARRYWYREPVALPRGTRLEVSAGPDDESAFMPPGAAPPAPADPADVRLTLDVVSRQP